MTTLFAGTQGFSFDQIVPKGRAFFMSLAVGSALLCGSLTGLQAASADVLAPSVDTGGSGGVATLPDFDQTQNGRSIALVESNEAQPVTVVDAPTQNERSILLIESKEAQVAGVSYPDFAQTANQRSTALIESKEAQHGTFASESQPVFAQTANERSIALIESKEAQGGTVVGPSDVGPVAFSYQGSVCVCTSCVVLA